MATGKCLFPRLPPPRTVGREAEAMSVQVLGSRRALAPAAAPLSMLMARTAGFLLFQATIAAAYRVAGTPDAWAASAAWWPVTATLTNLVCIALLRHLMRKEGRRYRDFWRFERPTFLRYLALSLALVVIAAPLVLLPNYGLAAWLFGDPARAADLFFLPLPVPVAFAALVAFPVTVAMAELPTYFGYAMPRLATAWGRPALAVIVAAAVLGAQHVALPLRFDAAFIVWRLLMFMPFALLLGLALHWRPRLLPFLMVIHGLLDLQAAWMVVAASTG